LKLKINNELSICSTNSWLTTINRISDSQRSFFLWYSATSAFKTALFIFSITAS